MSIVNNIENTENLMSELVTPVGAEIKVEVISPEEMDDDDFEPGGKYPSDEYICWLKHFLQKIDDENAKEVIAEKIEKLTEQMKKNRFGLTQWIWCIWVWKSCWTSIHLNNVKC